ncbi:hypothetical protein FDW91_08485 [Citrobacter sp. wls831]|uniref:winged helix-turn-helix domain-containing protein n=1 Tax=Citrobacter TaxID=544 RepID=UPI0010C935D9|nr:MULTISPECIES: winged helix-turn-helix domain-containing protein [Citrobacter]ELK6842994.1 winged helix-turn-helix domain-containing protein [Citrobacter braakii]MBJ9573323.1 winged helix-turn-helix domain-containing protein [Citrobacter braakii]TKU01247.1 hypothetical protein FDW91_08485 [Citrobacter sp. wls831]
MLEERIAYIISGNVYFSPDDGILNSISEPDSPIRLTTMVSVLFNILLEQSGLIVSREQVFDAVWGQYGLQPSNNSLNQYIHILRFSLQKLGCNSNVIQTIPRSGFFIPKELIEITSSPEMLTSEGNSVARLASELKVTEKQPKIKLIIVLFFMFILLFTMAFSFKFDKKDLFVGGEYYFTSEGCNYYTQRKSLDVKKNIAQKIIHDFISSKGVSFSCDNHSFALFYIEPSFFRYNHGRIFVAKCTKDPQNNEIKFCESLYENKK